MKRNENGTLASLPVGEYATIEEISSDCTIKRRLADLGFVAGKTVECVLKSPLGDPSAYLVRGALIALRRSDAARISVQK